MKKITSCTLIFLVFIINIFIMNQSYKNTIDLGNVIYIICITLILLLIYHFNVDITNLINPQNFILYFFVFFINFGMIISPFYTDILPVYTSSMYYLINCFIIYIFISVLISNKNIMKYLQLKDVLKNIETSNRYRKYIFIGISIIIIYFISIKTIPLLGENSDDLRVESLKGKGFIVLLGYGFLVNSIIFDFLYVLKREDKIYFIKSLVLYLFAFLVLMGTGYRGISFKIILILISILLMYKYKKLPIFKLSILIMILLSSVAIMGYYRSSNIVSFNLEAIYKVTIWRFFVNIYNFQNISNFVDVIGFINGKTYVLDILTLLPGHQISSSYYMKDILGLSFSGGGITPTLFGEALINFGYEFGLIIVLVVSVIISITSLYLCKNMNKSISSLQMLIVISFSLDPIIGSGIMPTILNSLIPVLICRFIIITLNNIEERKYYR
ncbi:oligosaccharide repeat unit polymerase [Clostridium intestinale]|uniref:oligosaccharide repeat unit polymerase n=1 Tax=Clostridium intestinale TaxID=36845 RepID=UPI002DD69CA9|nr:oligosaccharide repeat unit polymerase [Clostridium intestinale]